jgi:hypothetical protein
MTVRSQESPVDRIQVHSALHGGKGRVIIVFTAATLLVALPFAVFLFIQAGAMLVLLLYPGLAACFILVGYFLAKSRPLAFASREGLDFEWAWGTKRHIAWTDLHSVRESTIRGSVIERCFHLKLSKGSLDFYARSDLPELIAHFKRLAAEHDPSA